MATKKLSKKQREVLERMAAGEVVYIAPEGVFRWYPLQVAVRNFTRLVEMRLVDVGGGARFMLTAAGREMLKRENGGK